MKGSPSKEHYCYKIKIHTLLMKAYPSPSPPPLIIETTPFPYVDYPLPFLQENLDPPFYNFSKI